MAKRKKFTKRTQVRKKKATAQPRRNILDPAYIAWRGAVYARDNFTCRWCKRKKKHINAHHIRRWANYPSLRFVVSNGITLCTHCHAKVKDKEEEYSIFFTKLLMQALLEQIKNTKKNGIL